MKRVSQAAGLHATQKGLEISTTSTSLTSRFKRPDLQTERTGGGLENRRNTLKSAETSVKGKTLAFYTSPPRIGTVSNEVPKWCLD
jgi:hypothetical protein